MSRAEAAWAGRRVLLLTPTPTYPPDTPQQRRLHLLCSRLHLLGAGLHLLHYPYDPAWRDQVPREAEAAMQAAAESYRLIPPTRSPIVDPGDTWTEPDAGWDHTIGQMLDWLFSTADFDALIVCGAWLTKAFEFAPPRTFLILDAPRGLPPNRSPGAPPFAPSPAAETICLDRAELIWTDGAEEMARLGGLTSRPVLVLPMAEPGRLGWPRAPRELLRFGLAGGDDPAEIAAVEAFIAAAAACFDERLLSCLILLAGPVCDHLTSELPAFVRVLGRSAGAARLVEECDVLLAPLAAAEAVGTALGRGRAVIALAEAFRGFVPADPAHALATYEAMLELCVKAVATPALVEQLEQAAVTALSRTLRTVDQALANSVPPPRPPMRGVVFVLAAAEAVQGSPLLDHVCEAALFAGHFGEVGFFIEGSAPAEHAALLRLRAMGPVFISREAATAAGRVGDRWATSLEQILAAPPLCLWFASRAALPPAGLAPSDVMAVLPLPALAQDGVEDAILGFAQELQRLVRRLVALDPEPTALLREASRLGIATHLVPSLWRGEASELLTRLRRAEPGPPALLCASPHGKLPELAAEVAMACTQGRVDIVYDDRAEMPALPPAGAERLRFLPASAYVAALRTGRGAPRLLAEIGPCSAYALLGEIADRAGIPRLALFQPLPPRPSIAGRPIGVCGGVVESAAELARCLMDEEAARASAAARAVRYADMDDGGWTILWDALVEQQRHDAAGPAPESREERAVATLVRMELIAHIRGRGTFRYGTEAWAGHASDADPIEAFGLRPLEGITASDIEYRAFGPEGRETPWVGGAQLCGTRDQDIPLTGFAVRLAPPLRTRFAVVYRGVFGRAGLTAAGQDGENCVAPVADAPLLAMSIQLTPRAQGARA